MNPPPSAAPSSAQLASDALTGVPEVEPSLIELVEALDAEQIDAVRELFQEYARSLSVDLCFQDFDAELEGLPGEYASPEGTLLLAYCGGALAGCGAMRPLPDAVEPNACEMKRLYVRRAFRRFGLGRTLAEALMAHATRAGYSSMYLDTLDDMEAARGLYASLGFEDVPPYYFNPIPGAHYLRASLEAHSRY
ncbi:MAG TPA: GNAT family N-acetyltransferase [Burkholderiaceae bacterium]|jgi:ribosomal protein S18 acetylase RimI-like enzyme|nr:GNAT family N-acetyltransferase [Burkholderiaceae bacterium]